MDAADELRWIVSVLQGSEPSRDDVNTSLTLIAGLRHDLDRIEHRLIGLARSSGSGWQEIATSLGVRSRQAAEQRYLRLEANAEPDLGVVRKRLARRREMDARAGERAARLRTAAGGLVDELERSTRKASTDGHDAVARLALRTLRIAVDGEAGPLFDLAALAVSDLDGLPPSLRTNELEGALAEVCAILASPHPGMIEPS